MHYNCSILLDNISGSGGIIIVADGGNSKLLLRSDIANAAAGKDEQDHENGGMLYHRGLRTCG